MKILILIKTWDTFWEQHLLLCAFLSAILLVVASMMYAKFVKGVRHE